MKQAKIIPGYNLLRQKNTSRKARENNNKQNGGDQFGFRTFAEFGPFSLQSEH